MKTMILSSINPSWHSVKILRGALCNFFTELHRGKAQSHTEI